MRYEWDEEKRSSNLDKHGVDFEAMEEFDWEAPGAKVIWPKSLKAADIEASPRGGEMRYIATGPIGARLHVAVHTRRGERTRIISLRKADRQEVRDYERP